MSEQNIDRTRAFTPEIQSKVNRLPMLQRLLAMARPNSAETMTQEERDKHYVSSNYPELRYHSAGGGGVGSITPPKPRRF